MPTIMTRNVTDRRSAIPVSDTLNYAENNVSYHMLSIVTWHDQVCKTERSGGLFWGVSPHFEAMGTERLDQCNTNSFRKGKAV